MKYDIDDKARLVLKHIVYIAERTAKQIQFCFTKGKKQYYISPKRDIFLTFNLQSPIDFDYPIPDLNHFLSSNIKTIDSQKLITNKPCKSKKCTSKHIEKISGSKIRNLLRKNRQIPKYLMDPKISKLLSKKSLIN